MTSTRSSARPARCAPEEPDARQLGQVHRASGTGDSPGAVHAVEIGLEPGRAGRKAGADDADRRCRCGPGSRRDGPRAIARIARQRAPQSRRCPARTARRRARRHVPASGPPAGNTCPREACTGQRAQQAGHRIGDAGMPAQIGPAGVRRHRRGSSVASRISAEDVSPQ